MKILADFAVAGADVFVSVAGRLKNALLALYEWAIGVFSAAVAWIVMVVSALGYPGIVLMMALESSFVPFPSEVVIPPAGYLSAQGEMNIILVILCGILGSMTGASVNYFIARKYGRNFLYKYGKRLFLTEERLKYMDVYFARHGEITTLIGRMIPVVRQYISFPAGLAAMNYGRFLLYTGIGASVWVIILAVIGRMVGHNIDLVKEHVHTVAVVSVPVMIIIIVIYIFVKRYFEKRIKQEVTKE